MIRERKIKSGPLLEVDFYPVFADGRRIPARAPKTKPSTAEQAKYNREKATKEFIRLVNTNFDNTDILMHPTYEQDKAPQTEQEARRDMVNYLRRMKTYRAAEVKRLRAYLHEHPEDARAKKNLQKLLQPFRYAYVIEQVEYKTGKRAGCLNWHFHLFMTGGGEGDRDRAEEMWKDGMRTNADRFRPEKWGPEAAARYMSKAPQGTRRYTCSRNLKKPVSPPPRDGKITRRGVERLAKERVDDKEYWERRHPGYKFLRCYSRRNTYNGHYYVSVVMYKASGEPPKWEVKEWLDE